MCGVYPTADAKTAGEEISSTYEGRHVTLLASELTHAGAVVTKGLPVVFGNACGIAFKTEVAGTDLIPVDTEGIWVIDVHAADDGGNVAVVPGDRLYINTTTCVVSKIATPASQIPFGYALGSIDSGNTDTIAVKVHWDPVDNWVFEDEPFAFGDSQEHLLTWTGEEIMISGDRTLGGDGDYYRVLHYQGTVAPGAGDHWASIGTYTMINGGAGASSWLFGGSFSLVMETMDSNAYYGAVQAEVKNEADNSVTACALFCRWDNDSNVGCNGVMHSFIRFEDNSSGNKIQCLFELYGMDATAAASASAIVCQAGAANTASHVIKISANGIPYWIMMDSTPPA